ncbi:MAG TPA: CsbD family protein [Vicinamibacterales bacterium]|nr:CsbD family protein [Vicinamibacterales bacterium]
MNGDTLKGQWHQIKGEIKNQWGKLTDSDVDQIEGNGEKLVGKLQERYGFAKDRAEQEFRDFQAASNDAAADADRDATRH